MPLRIHTLLAVDERQLVGCAVSMRSIMDHVSPEAEVQFHVMTHSVSRADGAALVRTVTDTHGAHAIELYPIDAGQFSHLLRSKLVSHTTYARLLLGTVLPPEVRRCVYVDCDVIVTVDLAELWQFSLGHRSTAAVPNGDPDDARSHQLRLGLTEPRYLNAGLMLIDVDRWRSRCVGERALEHASRAGDRLILHDQDALNCALENDWVSLPRRWNASVAMSDWLTTDSEAVFHFMGAPKPWHADYSGPFGELFFRYADRTAFAGRRPWNPLGLGALFSRIRRSAPYLPTVLRLLWTGARHGRHRSHNQRHWRSD